MQYDQKIKTFFYAQNNDFTQYFENMELGRQGIVYSDITWAGKTHTPHSAACYKSILHMGFHTSQSNLLKKALIIVKLIAHK